MTDIARLPCSCLETTTKKGVTTKFFSAGGGSSSFDTTDAVNGRAAPYGSYHFVHHRVHPGISTCPWRQPEVL